VPESLSCASSNTAQVNKFYKKFEKNIQGGPIKTEHF